MAEEYPANKKNFSMLDRVKELPSLPQVLVGISRVAENEKSKRDDLAAMILHDQALTMRLLRISNSAQYAVYAQRVTTVSQAVMLLGFQSVRAIAMGAETYRLLSQLAKAGEVLERFWKDAIAVAVASQEMAALMNLEGVEEAFVAGLLHDVGKLIFAQCETEKAKRLYALGLNGVSLLEEETRLFGVNHAEIGAELARRWGLPSEIRTAMESHHRALTSPPATRGELLAFIVAISKALVSPMTLTDETRTRELSFKIARIIKKPVADILPTLRGLPARISAYADFFDIGVDDLKVYTLWVEEENQRLNQKKSAGEEPRRELERREALIGAIREIHSLMLTSLPAEVLVKKVADTARLVVGANRVMIASLDVEKELLAGLWHSGDVEQEFTHRFKLALFREGILAPVVKEGITVNVVDSNVPYFQRIMTKLDLATFDAPCFLGLPIVVNGRVRALFYADREADDEVFTDEDISNFETLASLAGIALKA